MTTYQLHVEETSQTFPIPAEIGSDDDLVRRALAGVVPYIDTAVLQREGKNEVITIKVVKSHAPKGAGDSGSCLSIVMDAMIASEGDGRNPVAAIHAELVSHKMKLHHLKPDEHLALSEQIGKAIQAGDELHETLKGIRSQLVASLPQAAHSVPLGF
jgi:hypothetical protein